MLYSTLESELAATIRQKKDLISHGVMKFGLLWTMFEPGCLIYHRTKDHDRIYQLKTAKYDTANQSRVYKLECRFVSYDGAHFGYKKAPISITEFQGTKKIAKLEAYPPEFRADENELRARLTARGKMFEAYKGIHFVGYDGIAMAAGGKGYYNVQSRIIIDAAAHIKHTNVKPALELFETREQTQDALSNASDEDIEDDVVILDKDTGKKPSPVPVGQKPVPPPTSLLTPSQLLTASPLVRGYSLRDKKWLSFSIDSIEDIIWHADAFSSLVMPAEQKDLVLSFAESQVQSRKDFDDFIPGKGQGIIMLLAGPPGVGKTLTAESVAEAMRAPLYSIGAADLGSEFPPRPRSSPHTYHRPRDAPLTRDIGKPSQLETTLHDILELCSKWKAGTSLPPTHPVLSAKLTLAQSSSSTKPTSS